MTILTDILAHKREELAAHRRERPMAEVIRLAQSKPRPPSFRQALLRHRGGWPALIAEIKRASPSKGVLRENLDAAETGRLYRDHGAAAISVLTDTQYFQGSLADLTAVSRAVALPLLRKDFIIDPYQVFEARAAGAAAVLLIVAALDEGQVGELFACAKEVRLDRLIEVHNQAEVERALHLGADLIGINNRDLATFEVDLETTAHLRPLIPAPVVVVAESGIHAAADVARVQAMGVDAILVGEAIVRAEDMGAKVRELAGGVPT